MTETSKLERLIRLRQAIIDCSSCTARNEAKLPIPWYGYESSKFMIIGRNPGRDEDKQGRPFVGRGGSCLNKALDQAGIARGRSLVTNTLKCYTSNDRQPTDEEYTICSRKHLAEEFKLFQPELVLALGKDAFHYTTGYASFIPLRKQFIQIALPDTDKKCLVLGTYHPGHALRDGQARLGMEEDIIWLAQTAEFKAIYSPVPGTEITT